MAGDVAQAKLRIPECDLLGEVGDEHAGPVRPQIMIPVPDRVLLVQDR